MITWSEYNARVAECVSSMPALRVGQAYYNVLHDTRPELAGVVRDSGDDPFYADSRIPGFLVLIRRLWSDAPREPVTCST